MKTRELIRLLQESDPSGEMECCIDNQDIDYVGSEPAYHDGCLQVMVRDPDDWEHVIGGRFIGEGYKLNISTSSLIDLAAERKDFPIEFEDVGEIHEAHYREAIAKRKRRREEVERDLKLSGFKENIFRRLREEAWPVPNGGHAHVHAVCAEFFEQVKLNELPLVPRAPQPESRHNHEQRTWTARVASDYQDGVLKLSLISEGEVE